VTTLLRRLLAPPLPPAAAPTRETIPVRLPDGREVAVLRVRDARARRIKLLVSERGARLTVPPRASLREAERFLAAHLDWLAHQLERYAPEPDLPPFAPGDAGPLPLRGAGLPLRWSEARALRIERDLDGVHIGHPAQLRPASLRRAVREFYLAEARRDVGRWLPTYLPALPRAPRLIRIRPLRSLWGSLSPDGALSLDLALVLGPPAAFEYVLVHELCHLIQANHSRLFWREVERRCPDWRAHRRWFRDEGMALKTTLARLIAP
jgi:predicted metal-dependent hydrolase